MSLSAARRRARQLALDVLARRYARRPGAGWGDGERLRVLIETWPGFEAGDWTAALDAHCPGWRDSADVRFVGGRVQRYALLPQAEVYVGTWLDADVLARAERLRWAHLALAGVEFLEELDRPAGLQVTTATGVAAEGIAEHVVGMMIALDRRLDLAVRRFDRGVWSQRGVVEHIRGLRGRTLGVIGLGHNGRAVARLACAMGMHVLGLDVRAGLTVDGVEAMYGPQGLHDLLRAADFCVLCVPLTARTRGMIDAAELAALGPKGYLINVARGAVVDERALGRALRRGQIAGAALDVLSREPPGILHPLRGCPNLIVTPHVAGNIHTFRLEIQRRFAANLRCFLDGDELKGTYHRAVA